MADQIFNNLEKLKIPNNSLQKLKNDLLQIFSNLEQNNIQYKAMGSFFNNYPHKILSFLSDIQGNVKIMNDIQSFSPKDLPAQKEMMMAQLNESKKIQLKLRNLITTQEKLIKSMNEKNCQLLSYIKEKNENISDLEKKLNNLTIEFKNKEKTLEAVPDQNTSFSNSCDSNNSNIIELKRKIEQFNQSLQDFKSQQEQLINQQNSIQLQKSQIEKEQTKQDTDLKKIEEDLEKQQENLQIEQKQFTKDKNSIIALQDDVNKKINDLKQSQSIQFLIYDQSKISQNAEKNLLDPNFLQSSKIFKINSICNLYVYQFSRLGSAFSEINNSFQEILRCHKDQNCKFKVNMFVSSPCDKNLKNYQQQLNELMKITATHKNKFEINIIDSNYGSNLIFQEFQIYLSQNQIFARYIQENSTQNVKNCLINVEEMQLQKLISDKNKNEKDLNDNTQKFEQKQTTFEKQKQTTQQNQKTLKSKILCLNTEKNNLEEEMYSISTKLENLRQQKAQHEQSLVFAERELNTYNQIVKDEQQIQLNIKKGNLTDSYNEQDLSIKNQIIQLRSQINDIKNVSAQINHCKKQSQSSIEEYENIEKLIINEINELFTFIWALTGFQDYLIFFFVLLIDQNDIDLHLHLNLNLINTLNISKEECYQVSKKILIKIEKSVTPQQVSITSNQLKNNEKMQSYIDKLNKKIQPQMIQRMQDIQQLSTYEYFSKRLNDYIQNMSSQL